MMGARQEEQEGRASHKKKCSTYALASVDGLAGDTITREASLASTGVRARARLGADGVHVAGLSLGAVVNLLCTGHQFPPTRSCKCRTRCRGQLRRKWPERGRGSS